MQPVKLVIAVPTYRRPRTLELNVRAVIDQAAGLVAAVGFPVDWTVVVVDNDPDRSAAETVAALGSHARYVSEPTPGIVAVRNRALDEAADADVLVFIDDDEVPQRQWLAALVGTWAEHRSDAVTGLVRPAFDGRLDPWVEAGAFFTRRQRRTGTEVSAAASNNLLLDMRRIREHGLRFDGRMAMAGGEDTLFSRTLVARGGTIVWCNESVAVDMVPASRANKRWVLARAVSHGNTAARVEQMLPAGPLARLVVRARNVVGGIVRVVAGAGRHLAGLVTGSLRHQARGARTACRGFGMAAGGMGFMYEEYARTDGWWRKWSRVRLQAV